METGAALGSNWVGLQHPYDRTFAISSLYIALAASHCPTPWMALIMYSSAVVSFVHWGKHHEGFWWYFDIFLSCTILLGHLRAASMADNSGSSWMEASGTGWCTCSLFIFGSSKLVWTPREHAMRDYHILQLAPHAAFRFCGFWTAMVVDGNPFCPWLSVMYWLSIILLGIPLLCDRGIFNCQRVSTSSHVVGKKIVSGNNNVHPTITRYYGTTVLINRYVFQQLTTYCSTYKPFTTNVLFQITFLNQNSKPL